MADSNFTNSNLHDIWYNLIEKRNQSSNDDCSLYSKESIQNVISSFVNLDKEFLIKKIEQIPNCNNDSNGKSNLFPHDGPFENFNSTPSWESSFESIPLSYQQNLNNNFKSNFDDWKELFNYSKSENKLSFNNNNNNYNRYYIEKDPIDLSLTTTNNQGEINETILNKLLEKLIMFSNQKDSNSKNNVINLINDLQKRKLTSEQYQKVQNVILNIYGNSNNYYNDPVQGYYNQELLMLLLKNQQLPNNSTNNKTTETTTKVEPIKALNQSNSNHVSLKDEIAMLSMSYRNKMGFMESDIEQAAALYRTSATMAQKNEAAYQWTGKLPIISYKLCQYSRKVFLGGVPWDSSENDLIAAFIKFGYLSVMFPQKDLSGSMRYSVSSNSLKGYCYIIFESEDSVTRLLSQCNKNESNGGDFYKISSPKFRSKDVQVIPWMIQDSQYCRLGSQKPDSKKTVFVGALHGMMTAYALANVMNELFDNVIFTALDTDKYKYPIGSGRVTFSSQKSYMRAVTANFIHVKTAKFSKTIQIDPYLEDSMCNNCFQSPGIYFCRSFECFRYFCSGCWQIWHNRCETLFNHKPLRRTFKPIFDL